MSTHAANDTWETRAASVYELYATQFRSRFKWLRSSLFRASLAADLRADNRALLRVLEIAGEWRAQNDTKLQALLKLLQETHPDDKVLIFTQFADTVRYLERELGARGVQQMAGVSGASENATQMAWRFSPGSNGRADIGKNGFIAPSDRLRVLVATDVLSEGQNLQDAHIIVNYDLPWAIIRLIQRAGRVDRIGQAAPEITCYSFLPAEGVEKIIKLRSRVSRRLEENAQVVGSDERFFEDVDAGALLDLYNEKTTVLDGEKDGEVDLASQAYQIWKNATDADPALLKLIPRLEPVLFATKAHSPAPESPEGVLVYVQTSDENDSLAWMNRNGETQTQSQHAILEAARCNALTPNLERLPEHHERVAQAVEQARQSDILVGGQLGKPSGARFKAFQVLKRYHESVKSTLLATADLGRVSDLLLSSPLQAAAAEQINRQFKIGATDEHIVNLLVDLMDDARLCRVLDDDDGATGSEARIICSMGLRSMA